MVTLAVALSLPETAPGRDLMLVAAFAVIFVTVLVQGLSLGFVIRIARSPENESALPALDPNAAEAAVFAAQLRSVEARAHGEDGTKIHPQLLRRYRNAHDLERNLDLEELAATAAKG